MASAWTNRAHNPSPECCVQNNKASLELLRPRWRPIDRMTRVVAPATAESYDSTVRSLVIVTRARRQDVVGSLLLFSGKSQ
jgi:hypothetical protein